MATRCDKGWNEFAQLGQGYVDKARIGLKEHPSLGSAVDLGDALVSSLAVGHFHTCVVTEANDVYCWGKQRIYAQDRWPRETEVKRNRI